MDGNGRWARRRGKSSSFGHRAGVRAIRPVIDACQELGIKVLSIYAFSTENWRRPRPEVQTLMRLFHEAFKREIDEMDRRGIRIVFSGRQEGLTPRMRERIAEAIGRTAANRNGILNVCFNYGGRAEVVDAVRRLIAEGVPADALDEVAISARLYVPELPEPDLIVRTAGERRTSNFLLWQSAYSELHVTDRLWPDFGPRDLEAAVADYQSRVRRFGGRLEDEVAT
jgi:undecaprenyl diphosphate synthase